jgi:hypothetical protein
MVGTMPVGLGKKQGNCVEMVRKSANAVSANSKSRDGAATIAAVHGLLVLTF